VQTSLPKSIRLEYQPKLLIPNMTTAWNWSCIAEWARLDFAVWARWIWRIHCGQGRL